MNEPLGQILPDSDFGKLLTELAKSANTIVEIGCWHGEGSTRCLRNGLVRPEQRMLSLENDPALCAEAVLRHADETRMAILFGTSFSSPLPEHIDLLLLDGDEGDSILDFMRLYDRSDVIALDDTNPRLAKKNVRTREILLERSWQVIADHQEDRNGWFIARRPGLALTPKPQ